MSFATIILASQSSFRRQLLASTGLVFDTAVAPIDEDQITAPQPRALAAARAEAKALAVARLHPQALVIGCDQVLDLQGRSYGKAADAGEAKQRLQEFSGHSHSLWSAYVLAHGTQVLHAEVVEASMPMRRLSEAEIDAYVATGEWQGCAGCYQYENRGVHLFDAVAADASAIIGLPLPQLLHALRKCGINSLVQPRGPWPASRT